MKTEAVEPYDILVVEDNQCDAELLEHLWSSCPVPCRLHFARDGEEASRLLFDEDARTYRLVLLDINLPRKDGREVLSEIRANAKLKKTPVIVLTTSRSDREITEMYEMGANAFVSKRVDLDEFQKVIDSLCSFWLVHVDLPHRKPRSR